MSAVHTEVPLPFDPGSYALLSEESSTDIAVIFIHGFGGHPEKTWRNFQELVDSFAGSFPLWRRCDLYFFKYDSIGAHIKDSSRKLKGFLDKVFPCPPRDIFEIRPEDQLSFVKRDDGLPIALRSGDFRYRELILCAHSEGGVVVRYTVLDIIKEFEDELEQQVAHAAEVPPLDESYEQFNRERQIAIEASDKNRVMRLVANYLISGQRKRHAPTESELRFQTLQSLLRGKLRFFAPAQLGASPSRLLGLLLASAGLGDFFRVLLNGSPAYKQMSQDSQILAMMRDNTQSKADQYQWMSSLRAWIMWGEADDVVVTGEYGCDREYSTEAKQTHISVCKPNITTLCITDCERS